MLNQLRVYKNKVHFANVPVRKNGYVQSIAQGPFNVIQMMEEFASGKTATTRHEVWSWEWMEVPKYA